MSIELFIHNLIINGLEHFRKFYGMYRGQVMSTSDPQNRGRIKVCVPSVGHSLDSYPDVWVDPEFDGAGKNRGCFWPPEVGDSVRVSFEMGDPSKPIMYVGGWFGSTDLPVEFAYEGSAPNSKPRRRGLITRGGHRLVLDDTVNSEVVELSWHRSDVQDAFRSDDSKTADRSIGKTSSLKFKSDGSVELFNMNGSKVVLNATDKSVTVQDENGNKIELSQDGMTVVATGKQVSVQCSSVDVKADSISLGDGASFFAVKGQSLVEWLNSHTHGSAMGPTAVPIRPATNAMLSDVVKIK